MAKFKQSRRSRQSKNKTKANLMVFLRPNIVREPSDLMQTTQERYEYMRVEEEEELWPLQ